MVLHTQLLTILRTPVLGVKMVFNKSLKIPKGGNQNPHIEEEQTTQWPKEKSKRTNNDLQNIHIKLKIE